MTNQFKYVPYGKYPKWILTGTSERYKGPSETTEGPELIPVFKSHVYVNGGGDWRHRKRGLAVDCLRQQKCSLFPLCNPIVDLELTKSSCQGESATRDF